MIACGAIEPYIFLAYVFTMFPKSVSYLCPNFQRHIFFITWILLGSSVRRRSGESEGVVKVLPEFPEATYMTAGIRSGVYEAHLCGRGLSSMVMEVRCISGLPN